MFISPLGSTRKHNIIRNFEGFKLRPLDPITPHHFGISQNVYNRHRRIVRAGNSRYCIECKIQ